MTLCFKITSDITQGYLIGSILTSSTKTNNKIIKTKVKCIVSAIDIKLHTATKISKTVDDFIINTVEFYSKNNGIKIIDFSNTYLLFIFNLINGNECINHGQLLSEILAYTILKFVDTEIFDFFINNVLKNSSTNISKSLQNFFIVNKIRIG